jgi:PAS domain S-box-containing protein
MAVHKSSPPNPDLLLGILDSMHDGVYVVGQDFEVEYANAAVVNEFGPVLAAKCYQYLHNRTTPCSWCKMKKVFAGKTVSWEFKHPQKDKYYHCIDSPLFNSDGRISKLKIIHDITADKQTAQTIRDLARFPQENPFPVLRLSAAGVILFSNDAGKALLEQWNCRKGKKAPRAWCTIVRETLSANHLQTHEIACGGRIFSIAVVPLAEAGYVNLYGRDITDHKQAEAALSAAHRNLQNIIDNTPALVYALDLEGRFVMTNSTLAQLFNAAPEQMIGKRRHAFMPREDADRHEVNDRRVIEAGRAMEFEEYSHLEDRSITWLTTKFPLFDAQGKIYGMAGISADITERKRMEEQIQRSAIRYEMLSETASELLECKTPKCLIDSLCSRVMAFLKCQVFVNYLVDEQVQRLHLNASGGLTEQTAAAIEWLDFGQAICGRVAQEGQRIVAENIQESCDPRADLVRSMGIRAYACHPIIVQGRVIGTLSFGTRTRIRFSDDDLSIMKTLTDQVAVAMNRLQTEEALRQAHGELEERVKERTEDLSRMVILLEEEIRQRKCTEEALKTQSRDLDAFFSTTLTPLVMLDREFNFVRVNKAYADSCRIEIPKILSAIIILSFIPMKKISASSKRSCGPGRRIRRWTNRLHFPTIRNGA